LESAQPESLLRRWLPPIGWAAVIFTLSTGSFSSDNTGRFIVPFLHWLLPHATPDTIAFGHEIIRKSAHFTEYFIFSVIMFHAIRGSQKGWRLRWALLALAIVACYSATDEFYQIFVPGREASPWDSLLDTFGASIGQIALWLWTLVR
jgi:VanZ family protein